MVKEKIEGNLSLPHRKREESEAPVRKTNDFFEIFYTLSHELRTPLTLSIGPLEEVLRGILFIFNHITDNTECISQIINLIL